jgi:hypothetical protein
MSSDGVHQTAVGGDIYISTNSGETWALNENSPAVSWRGIAMSSDGQHQTAVVNDSDGDIYVSNDYGDSWTGKEKQNYWRGIAMSRSSDPLIDGKYQTAVADDDGEGDYIYVSNDFGENWSPKGNSLVWYGVAMSGTGQYQTAVVYGGYIYGSIDYGVNWTQRTSDATRDWQSVAMSSDGVHQTAVTYHGQIYTSANHGDSDTWVLSENSPTASWRGIAMSGTGQYQTAVTSGEGIYTSVDYGYTWDVRGGKDGNYLLTSTNTFAYPLAVEAKAKVGSDWDDEYGWNFGLSWDSDWQTNGYFSGHYKDAGSNYSSLERFSSEIETDSDETNESITADTWYRLSLLVGSSAQHYNVDDTQKASLTTSPPTEALANIILSTSRLNLGGNYTTYFDWVFVREYSYPEPLIIAGSEQTFYSADINTDGDVDFLDYTILALHWMAENCAEPNWCNGADLNKLGQVNTFDLAILAEHWLEGK